ncbi:MAG TPA: pseudouridine synthase [Nitrospirota bacterium]|nr:pseudouridine synthase [Nitrospirota bacterium]
MQERIQKIISAAGVTSRRAAEQLISEGRVRVNGQVVTELGTKADAAKDHIKVDGKLINPRQPLTYIMLNKPAGFVTTMADPEGRPTVLSLLKGIKIRVYPVGRLDYNTEGLLLLTNDGDFAHLITHPRHELPKTYRAKVKGVLEDRQISDLENGIYLDDGRTAPAMLKKLSKEETNSWLEITIREGRKRQVRRMFDRVGHSVIKLKRIRTGNLILGDLPEGAFRYLTPAEVNALKELAVKEQMAEVRGVKPEAKKQHIDDRSRRPKERSIAQPGQRTDLVRRSGGRKPRSDEALFVKPGGEPKQENRRQVRGERIPGQGASGRGPRRPPRGHGRKQAPGFTGSRFEDRMTERPALSGSRIAGASAWKQQRTFKKTGTGKFPDAGKRRPQSTGSGSRRQAGS